MTFKDICTRRTYTKDGVEKSSWLKCGTLKTLDNGKQFIELNHLPGISFYVFEQKAKEGAVPSAAESKPSDPKDINWEE